MATASAAALLFVSDVVLIRFILFYFIYLFIRFGCFFCRDGWMGGGGGGFFVVVVASDYASDRACGLSQEAELACLPRRRGNA